MGRSLNISVYKVFITDKSLDLSIAHQAAKKMTAFSQATDLNLLSGFQLLWASWIMAEGRGYW